MKFVSTGAAAAAACILFSSTVSAASEERLTEALIVTATRVEQPISEVIGAVSVITRSDIDRRGARSVQDLLRGETGLGVVNNGGLGKLSNVFLRGADAEQVLVLVDGVRVGSATSGTTAFELIPVDQIERIEIIRGPRSSIYGSDAIGGVIQIFTRRASAPSMSLGYGSHGTSSVSGNFGAASESAWISLGSNYLESDGFNSCSGAPFPPGGGCFTDEPDADAYRNTSGSLRTGYRWTRAEVEATALYAAGTTEYDGSFANENDFVQRVVSLRGKLDPTESWSVSLMLGESRDQHDNFFDDPMLADERVFSSRFDKQRSDASLQSDWHLAHEQILTLGSDYYDDEVQSDVLFEQRSRDNLGVFAQYQVQLGAHRLLASARTDDNEQFGRHETGSFGWKWALSERWSVTGGWGTAFGAPSFNDLYYPGFSNPDLDPETSESYELGVGWANAGVSASLGVFENRVEDLIVYDATIFAPNNLNRARVRGIEADADVAVGDWTLSLGVSALDARNRTSGTEFDNYLPRRARHSGHIEVGRAIRALDIRARLTAEGSRYDDVFNTHRVGGYGIVDVMFDYALSSAWTVQGKLGNALDREYRTVRYYNQDDRTFFLGVRYQPR
jgi:vitamin B12 transporter